MTHRRDFIIISLVISWAGAGAAPYAAHLNASAHRQALGLLHDRNVGYDAAEQIAQEYKNRLDRASQLCEVARLPSFVPIAKREHIGWRP